METAIRLETERTSIRAYHFIPEGAWKTLLKGDSPLRPSNTLVRPNPDTKLDLPDDAWAPYLFCFIDDPVPKEWKRNALLPKPFDTFNEWRSLMASIFTKAGHDDFRIAALTFNVRRTDNAFVVDAWELDKPMLRVLTGDITEAEADKIGWEGYYNSKKRLDEYKEGTFMLTELIIGSLVSLDRISVAGTVNNKLQFRPSSSA